jgi:DNA-binding winged helix-turn-helix (wHTH) protein
MAQSQADSGWIYQCDDIVVEPRAHRLERAGVALQVEPKAYAVLTVLLQQAGDVVSKDDLLDAAWGHRHVTPGVLSRAISQLRRALGDCATHPRYIATVHSLGYRFIGEVRRTATPATATESLVSQVVAEQPGEVDVGAMPSDRIPKTRVSIFPTIARWLPAAITLAMIAALLAAVGMGHSPPDTMPSPRNAPRPALVILPFAHSSDPSSLHPRHWPRNRRIATAYPSAQDDGPYQARAADNPMLHPEQGPSFRE